ncbi:MAG: F0F1 ATP synthase subunit gamma [Hydrogenophaga sp.]|uniref:F0F1 ATP synthase subunit gamma n=1 Tax=Hydrogenophaga sp. TaxID=1904254 RepID=UPI001D5D95F6|nr:FoF1 ATP synthase subunit gamma [Hydrogenophaga sp.]MBX3611080.1 F0F1 ATP synthase subunit gamma [Hydrogenophaga sp.]
MDASAQDLHHRLGTVTAFGDLANAMRGVAAARLQQARTLIAGIDDYTRTVTAAMGQARALLPPAPARAPGAAAPRVTLTVLIGAEQGFNGGLSERVLDAAGEATGGRVLMVGSQLRRLAHARGCTPQWFAPMVAHADAASTLGDRLHTALARALASEPLDAVEIIGSELAVSNEGENLLIRRRNLTPQPAPDDRPPTKAPRLNVEPARLIDDLLVEYVAAQLTRAVLHGHAAEQLARLRTMAAASENVQRMVQGLRAEERQWRQEAITGEVIELAAALSGSAKEGR